MLQRYEKNPKASTHFRNFSSLLQGFFIYLFHLAVFYVHPCDRDDMKMYLW